MTYAPTIYPKLRAYYRSKKWRVRKALYWANHERMCLACMWRGKNVQLNHVRYPKVWWRWGNEPDRWFYPLCGRCHDTVTRECRAKRRPGRKVDIRQVTLVHIHRTRTARKLPRFREHLDAALLPVVLRNVRWKMGITDTRDLPVLERESSF